MSSGEKRPPSCWGLVGACEKCNSHPFHPHSTLLGFIAALAPKVWRLLASRLVSQKIHMKVRQWRRPGDAGTWEPPASRKKRKKKQPAMGSYTWSIQKAPKTIGFLIAGPRLSGRESLGIPGESWGALARSGEPWGKPGER